MVWRKPGEVQKPLGQGDRWTIPLTISARIGVACRYDADAATVLSASDRSLSNGGRLSNDWPFARNYSIGVRTGSPAIFGGWLETGVDRFALQR
jgi:hypothetical protein